jgi:hypothetical protein
MPLYSKHGIDVETFSFAEARLPQREMFHCWWGRKADGVSGTGIGDSLELIRYAKPRHLHRNKKGGNRMLTIGWRFEHTQSLIKKSIELVSESEALVQDTKATRRRLNRSRRLCRKSLRSLKARTRSQNGMETL